MGSYDQVVWQSGVATTLTCAHTTFLDLVVLFPRVLDLVVLSPLVFVVLVFFSVHCLLSSDEPGPISTFLAYCFFFPRSKKKRLRIMTEPRDPDLYRQVKKKIYEKIPQHSAYRSGILVQQYKRAYKKKYGPMSCPYRGKRSSSTGLQRWFREKWRNSRGEVGYKYKSDIYRPTRRVNRHTPKTFQELTAKQIRRARKEKRRRGRVKHFA